MRKFFGLTSADRNLLACVTLLLLLMRCGLALLGYARLRRFLSSSARTHRRATVENTTEVDRIVWAVNTAGRWVLGEKPCLSLAMATEWLLSRSGFRSDLRIGVMRDDSGKLEAHAWVERDGRVLIGQSASLDRFERLPALNL